MMRVQRSFGMPVQDAVAMHIARGVSRLFAAMGHATVLELSLANGRRADVVALSASGEITIIEVKSCAADYRSDQKWPDYGEYCDRYYFAVSPDFPQAIIPDDIGLIVADAYGGAILRESAVHVLAAARRKAVTLRFAQCAAERLGRLLDPEIG